MTTDRKIVRLNVEMRLYRTEADGSKLFDEIYAIVRVDDKTDSQRYTAVTPGLEFDKCVEAAWTDNRHVPAEKVVADALRLVCTKWANEVKMDGGVTNDSCF